ncbi:DMT family transporter [Pyramidobacter piscolens]|uniref:DMT family transporter n=1 Tax=Pyramidobacter piscolens TaxID=638849 RepID=UPI003AB6B245
MSRTLKGILLAGTTGLCWGLTTLATKLIGGAGVAVSTAVFARMVVVVAALGPWLRLRHPEQLKVSRRDFARIFLFSLLGPSGLYLGFMLSVVYLSAPTALVLHYTYPILTALCSPLITGERPSRRDFAGACLVTAGVTCSVLTPEWTLNTQIDVRGLLWGAVAVVGLAGQTLLVRATVTRGGIGRWGFFYYTHLGGMFWIGLYITLTGQWGEFARITPYIAALVLVPTLTGCLLGYSLYYKSLEYVPASVSSLMASLEILSGTALTALATNVAPTAPEIVGCVCIFAAIALVSLSRLEKVPLRS